jgi:prepilin-type N-terminal cleavage/methylation domain-containing protein
MGGEMTNSSRRAFTLIELLVVIGILAILIGILIPAITGAMGKAERIQAKADTQRLVKGWKAYWNQYGRWPGLADESVNGVQMVSNIVRILNARYYQEGMSGVDSTPDNPMAIQFVEISGNSIDASWSFVDPWGAPYRVSFDANFDGKVSATNGTPIYAAVYDRVIAWSAGPDTNSATIADNIKSWE